MYKEIIVIGDVEIGAGNLTDDFISDNAFSELINSLARSKHPVDLVLNGDIFDFLKCPYRCDGKLTYPRHITAEISLNKLHLMYEAHPKVFQAWKNFVSHRQKRILFIIGNHDHDLFFKPVREQVKKLLGNSPRVIFPGLKYINGPVYVEHGHQYDFLNQINFKNLFLNYKGKSILNFPWVPFGLISNFMDMKEEHPFMERISPRNLMLSLHGMVIRKISLRSLGYFLKSVLYYPFRYYSDPTYSFPSNLLQEFYQRLKTRHWDVDEVMDVFRKQRKYTQAKISVLGHIHEKKIKKTRGQVIIHPGSWKDEYILNPKTRTLTPKKKHYVQIKLYKHGCDYEVKEYPIPRSIFLFDDVRKDEFMYLHLAAKEEGYKLRV